MRKTLVVMIGWLVVVSPASQLASSHLLEEGISRSFFQHKASLLERAKKMMRARENSVYV